MLVLILIVNPILVFITRRGADTRSPRIYVCSLVFTYYYHHHRVRLTQGLTDEETGMIMAIMMKSAGIHSRNDDNGAPEGKWPSRGKANTSVIMIMRDLEE